MAQKKLGKLKGGYKPPVPVVSHGTYSCKCSSCVRDRCLRWRCDTTDRAYLDQWMLNYLGVWEILDGTSNTFAKSSSSPPFSPKYQELLKSRRSLPVFQNIWSLFEKISQGNQFLLVDAPLGSGKTTQIPALISLYHMAENARDRGEKDSSFRVVCSEPNNLAAGLAAVRVAEEMDVTMAKEVGYTTVLEQHVDENTVIEYTTHNKLLRNAVADPLLGTYSVVILDEVHDRSHETDVLMWFLRDLAKKRPTLKIIFMGAQIDHLKYQKYFGNVSMLEISELVPPAPVTVVYSPKPVADYLESTVSKIVDLHRENTASGDILAFLADTNEVKEACHNLSLRAVQSHYQSALFGVGKLEIVPLYENLSSSHLLQQVVFGPRPLAPGGLSTRRCFVATSVAESSIALNNISYVVNCGLVKNVMSRDGESELMVLTQTDKTKARQRASIAGRSTAGKCYRLFTKMCFEMLDEESPPEKNGSGSQRSQLAQTAISFWLEKLGSNNHGDVQNQFFIM